MPNRREFLGYSSALSAAALAANASPSSAPSAVDPKGGYARAELAKPAWSLGVVQSRVRAVEMGNYRREIKDNLAHMLELIDKAFYYGGKPDLLFFHEFPITGWRKWTRAEILQFAIEIPGEETEAIAKKAREYGCYIVFGSYARDKDWPNHVLSITTVMGPDGAILDKHWKARNIKGVFPGFELFTTCVYDVLDRYVEMYGWDHVVPVTQTPLGNICTSSIQREPELFRAMAMRGAEVILRTASGGFNAMDIQMTSVYNQVYTAICNNAYSPNNAGFFDDAGSGGTAIYGPRGDVLAEADGKFEQLVTTTIPIQAFRATKTQPIVHMEMYLPTFQAYRSKYGPNLFSEYLPTDLNDAARFLRDKSRW
jgi:predicted amidohydrolase